MLGIQLCSKCHCCVQSKVESMQHIFIDSEAASFVWASLSALGLQFEGLSAKHRVIKSLTPLNIKSKFGFFSLAVIGYTMLELWSARNLAKYEGKYISKSTILHNIITQAKSVCELSDLKEEHHSKKLILSQFGIKGGSSKNPILKIVKWLCPPWPLLKLNTDGASKNPEISGGGGIVRDFKGDVLIAFSHFYGAANSIIAEARALLDGIYYLKLVSPQPTGIECDSKILVQAINSQACYPWTITPYVREIKALLSPRDTVTHVFREANVAADLLASHACSKKCNSFFFYHELPPNVKGAAQLDKLGVPSIRTM